MPLNKKIFFTSSSGAGAVICMHSLVTQGVSIKRHHLTSNYTTVDHYGPQLFAALYRGTHTSTSPSSLDLRGASIPSSSERGKPLRPSAPSRMICMRKRSSKLPPLGLAMSQARIDAERHRGREICAAGAGLCHISPLGIRKAGNKCAGCKGENKRCGCGAVRSHENRSTHSQSSQCSVRGPSFLHRVDE